VKIELTDEQVQTLDAEGSGVIVVDPRNDRSYRLVLEEVFQTLRGVAIDGSPWTPFETGILAGNAFGLLDDTDYNSYLEAQ